MKEEACPNSGTFLVGLLPTQNRKTKFDRFRLMLGRKYHLELETTTLWNVYYIEIMNTVVYEQSTQTIFFGKSR